MNLLSFFKRKNKKNENEENKREVKTYRASVLCKNCTRRIYVNVEWGTGIPEGFVYDAKTGEQVKCLYCGYDRFSKPLLQHRINGPINGPS